MGLKTFVVPLAALSLTISSTAAQAAGAVSSVPVSSCAAAVAAGAAVAAQGARPGCVLPAIDVGAPVPVETAVSGPGLASWILPVLGLAGLAALVLAIKGGNNNSSGSLSRG